MSKNMRNRLILSLLLLIGLTSCKFRPDDKINWDTQLLAPMLKSSVTLQDAIQDTSLLQVDANNFITMVFRDTLVDLKLIEEVTVPDTAVEAQVTLDSISLTTDSLTQDITLADIAHQLSDQGNPIGDTILARHGSTMFFLPGFMGLSSDDVNIDASLFFEEATLLSGDLVVTIENQLPVDIEDVIYHLRNNGTFADTLIRRTIPSIPTGTSVTDTADLAGKTVESQLAGKLENISTVSAFNVPIDTNDYIRLKIVVRDLKASRATAVFPAQTVIDDNFPVKYYFGDGIELTKMGIGSGNIEVSTISTINDTLEFIYSLPSATRNGQPVVLQTKLNPAPIGGQVTNQKEFDLNGYFVDLTLNGDSVNLFPQRLIGNLIYSGNLVTMDLADSIKVFYGLLDIIPSYVEGYLGTQSFDFQDSIDFDFFSSILGGTFDLKRPTAELKFINSVGMDGELRVNNFTAYNSRTGNSVALNAPFVSQRTFIPGPKLPNVGQTVETTIRLDRNNSNIRDFISLLPDRLDFDLSVVANGNANPNDHDNFATDESRIAALLDLEIPMEGIANQILLKDTLDLNLTSAAVPTEVTDGNLKLLVENTFPFETNVQIYFLAPSGLVIDSLFGTGGQSIPAGVVNANGFVDTPGIGVLESFFDQNKLDRLTSQATKAIASFSLSTLPAGQHVKIFSTYGIDFKLVGDFMYKIGG